jgi:3-methylfumaryl-CoA hydratase
MAIAGIIISAMTREDCVGNAPLDSWVGRTCVEQDIILASPVSRLFATLQLREERFTAGFPAPLLTHWIHFLPSISLDDVGPDGHPKRGGFLPPIPLPRRMWAGSDLVFHRPLQIGAMAIRRSTIGEVSEKQGRSGALVFVRVDHEVHDARGLVLSDSHTIVYRDLPASGDRPSAVQAAPTNPQWKRRIDPDPVLLFHYSALTFNGHRIHYDRSYAMEVEGYPGLIVHGPMIATFLLHELIDRHPDVDIESFRFRAVKPIFDIEPFFICGSIRDDSIAELFACDPSGALCMSATATLR